MRRALANGVAGECRSWAARKLPVDVTTVSGGEVWQTTGTKDNQLLVQFVRQQGTTVITAQSVRLEN